MEATEDFADQVAPAQRLTPQQRATLIEYARAGTVHGAAQLLGIGPQTVKNHLSEAYRRLGVKTGPQAVYVLFGGEDVIRALPPALQPRQKARLRSANPRMPALIDGEMRIHDIRLAGRVGHAEASAGAGPTCDTCGLSPLRVTLVEAFEWLALYVRHPRSQASGTG